MFHQFPFYVVLLLIILLLVVLARRLRMAYPVMLVLGGLSLSFIPGMPDINIDPEMIFVIFLPPLLYEAAWLTSWKEFWRWRRVIGSFAFLIVLITSLVVAWVAHSFIPGFTLALGFLLGGIVSPPDAVSAAAIIKNVDVPGRVSALLEGESLMNDASSLIVFRFALLAVATGHFVWYEAAGSFVWVIVAGILIGVLIGYAFYWLHRLLHTDVNTDIVLTLITPYAMYIVAEMLHVSGVLAVVSGGLFLSARRHEFLSYQSRLRGTNVWSALAFVLNGLVFMLIGLELPVIVQGLEEVSLMQAIGYGVLITAVLMVSRVLCALGASVWTVFISRYITTADNRPGWRFPLVVGWAGMRGVVSLAAALSVPVYLSDGTAFPQRNLILFITFVVILLTLVVQGLSLPWLIRVLNLPDPEHALSEEEQHQQLRQRLARESLAFLKEHAEPESGELHPELQRLITHWEYEQSLPDGDELMTTYQDIYRRLITRQREWLLEWNKELETNEDVIRRSLQMLDVEEEKLKLRYG